MHRSGFNDLTSVITGSSRSSFINTICKFVRDVDEMNETVLVPSLLTDLDSSPSQSSNNKKSESFDLQTLHQLLNRLKEELTIARFDDVKVKSCSITPANNILSAINCNNNINNSNCNNSINVTTPMTQSSSSNLQCSSTLGLAEGELTGLSKKASSCKCSDSDDGFSSLNSYSRNSDDESTSSSPSSDSDSECCSSSSSTSSTSSSSSPNQSRENESNIAESSPEYIVNLLRLHIQGIQSILNRFSKSADQVSESYVNSLN